MELETVIKQFCDICGRKDSLFSIDLGSINYIDKRNVFFDKRLKVKNILKNFYEHIYIEDKTFIGGILSLQLYSEQELLKGLNGWRWFYENGNQKEDPNWLDSWIVVGNKNEDIVFVKTELEYCPVYGIITGSFEEIILSENFCAFIKALTVVMEIEKQFNYKVKSEDFSINHNFYTICKTTLSNIICPNVIDNFMKFFF
jgi:hypothetical protein